MLKGFKKKNDLSEYPFAPLAPKVKCIKCGKPISWGDFAYDQNTCWKCFEAQVYRIARNTETIEENKIVMHLLKSMEEIIRRKL